MSTDTKTTGELVTAPADDRWADLMRYAVEKGPDGADALKTIMEMRDSDEDRAAKRDFVRAFNRTQRELPAVLKDHYNEQTRSKYPKLADISRTIRPVYTRHGFSMIHGQEDCPLEGHMRVVVDVMHESGHSVQKHADIPIDAAGIKGSVNKTPTHAAGSTLSYAMRYLDVLVWAPELVERDADGNVPGAPVEPITEDQLLTLRSLLDELDFSDAENAAFLEWLKVETLSAIPADRYNRAVVFLESKRGAAQ